VSDAVFRFVWTNFDHVLAALLLISRLGHIGTTYLITPTLRLEANPVVRKIGEEEYQAILIRAARRSRPIHAILPTCLSASFMMLTGLVVLFFYPDWDKDWGFYLGSGIVLYGAIIGLYGTLSMRRLFRLAAAAPDAST
jgi:hypothetical protein